MKFNEKKYLEHHGLICPYCDSDELMGGHAEFDDNYAWRNVVCENCGKEWTEVLTLTGAQPLKE